MKRLREKAAIDLFFPHVLAVPTPVTYPEKTNGNRDWGR